MENALELSVVNLESSYKDDVRDSEHIDGLRTMLTTIGLTYEFAGKRVEFYILLLNI
jgi:hypothetical protein